MADLKRVEPGTHDTTVYTAEQEYIWADYMRVCEDGHVTWVGWENQKPQ